MSEPINQRASDNAHYLTQDLVPKTALVPSTIDLEESAHGGVVPWTTAVDAYLNAAIDSEHTGRAYARHLRDAQRILGVASVSEVSGMELSAYRAAVIASDLALASQRQALAAVRSFLTWHSDLGGPGPTGGVIKSALKPPRGSTGARYNVLNEEEIAAILRAAVEPRDKAVLSVLLGAGLGVSETSKLGVADVVEDYGGGVALFVRQGKGKKDRSVPVREEVDRAIREYLVATGRVLGSSGPLFLAADRGAGRRSRHGLSPRAISRLVVQLADDAGISAKRVSPHALRHRYAIRCLREGGNVVAVARLLGHSSIATTQRYVDHLALSELRATVPALPLESGPGDTSNGARGYLSRFMRKTGQRGIVECFRACLDGAGCSARCSGVFPSSIFARLTVVVQLTDCLSRCSFRTPGSCKHRLLSDRDALKAPMKGGSTNSGYRQRRTPLLGPFTE